MANRIREMNWEGTPMGPIERWSPGFRSTLSICLRASSPAIVFWGPDLLVFFNDAAIRSSALLDPRAVGKPAREALESIWPRFGPVVETTRRNGSTVELAAQQGGLHQEATPAERFFNISFVPVSERGEVAGVLVTETDVTQLVVSKRRQRTLWDLMTRSTGVDDISEAARSFANGLRDNPADIPFACIYSFSEDGRHATLEAAVRIEPGTSLSPKIFSIDRGHFIYEGVDVRTEVPQAFDLGPGFASLPADFPEAASVSIAVLPIYPFGTHAPAGALLTGMNPHQRFEGEYRNFLELVAAQLGRAFSQAQARIREKQHLEEIALARRNRIEFFEEASAALRGPLTLLTAPLEELDSVDPSHAFESRQKLQLVRQAGTQLIRLLDALQDYSDIETGITEVHYEPVDLSILTSRPAETFRSVIERAGIRFAVETPPMPEPAYIDAELWEKVVLNLVSNAFQHTVHGEIRVKLGLSGDRFVLEVSDTGTGISEKERQRLFTPFGRVPCASERARRGLGLGLALSRAFLELHGGSLEILNRPDHGSRVIASIPRGKDHLAPGRIGAKGPHPWARLIARARLEEAEAWLANQANSGQWVSRPIQDAPQKRVLVAEDSPDLREYLLALLSGIYTTEAVADVEHAVLSARMNPPDLVVAESSLRNDGGTLVQALRSESATQSVPVILLTEDAAEEARLRALSAGADDYLLKPFSARELMLRAHSQIAVYSRRKRSSD